MDSMAITHTMLLASLATSFSHFSSLWGSLKLTDLQIYPIYHKFSCGFLGSFLCS